MANSRTIILIAGMHRSGTSAVTRLLNILGADLGSRLLDAQPGVNDAGFWEHEDLVDINERILQELDSAWFDFRSYPEKWWQGLKFTKFQEEIISVIEQDFSTSSLIAFKDPRLCRLLPLWLEALRNAHFDPRCLLVLRNPSEVARSLIKRDGFDEGTAFSLWLSYVLDCEFYSRRTARSAITYDSLLEDWKAVANRISMALDIQWPNSLEKVTDQVAEELRSDLRHQRIADIGEDAGRMDLTQQAHALYGKFSNASPELQMERERSRWYARLRKSSSLADALFSTNRLLVDVRKRLHDLGKEHRIAVEVIAERDRQLAEANENLHRLGKQHSHAVGVIATRDRQLAEANENLHRLGKQHSHAVGVIATRDRQLAEANENLHRLGKQHRYALDVVSERDGQLSDINENLQRLGKEHSYALEVIALRDERLAKLQRKLDLITSHRMWPVLRKFIKEWGAEWG